MKCRMQSISVIAVLLFFSQCTYNNIDSVEKAPVGSVDYFMFGHLDGFCMQCDQLYKIANGKLYGARFQVISDPDAVSLQQLPGNLYDLVSSINSQIPNRIVTGSTTSVNRIGTYFPDAGHTYIEVSQNRKIYRWYIEPGDLPSDVADFVKAVNDAMGQLN